MASAVSWCILDLSYLHLQSSVKRDELGTTLHVDLFVCERIIGSNFAVASGLPKSIDGCFELDRLQMEPAEVVEKEDVVESKLFMKE